MKFKITAKQILWGMIISYIAAFGIFTCLRHYNFQTQTWDLAAFVQTFWNTVHGRIMQNNVEQVHNHLGLHMSPWLLVLAPGYAIFPSPYYLLIIQTIIIALGAWSLYLLAKKVIGNQWLSLVVAISYLLYPSLQGANSYDFHEITSFIPLLLAAFYFIEEERWGWAIGFLALAASVKEDAILTVLFVGIYLLFRMNRQKVWLTKQRKIGIVVIIGTLIYFVVAVKILMPAFGGGVLRFDRYANLGGTAGEIVKNVSAHPNLLVETIFTKQKLFYFFLLFLPVAFLPFLSWRTLLFLIPGLAENLLTNYTFQFNSLYHYDAILIPGIFFGAVYGLKFIQDRWPAKINWAKWILLSCAIFSFLTRSRIGPFSFPLAYFQPNAQWDAYRKIVDLVPEGVSVAANTNLVPHLAHREFIYALGHETFLVDMVLVDLDDPFGFKDQKEFDAYLGTYLKSGLYQGHLFDDRYLIITSNKLKLVSK